MSFQILGKDKFASSLISFRVKKTVSLVNREKIGFLYKSHIVIRYSFCEFFEKVTLAMAFSIPKIWKTTCPKCPLPFNWGK
jgi:hypothetical protein